MSEEKKEGSGCSSSGCGCCKGLKLIIGLLFAAFIFASGMWFGKCHGCYHHQMGGGYCPFSAPQEQK